MAENFLIQDQTLRQEQTLSARQMQSLTLLHTPILELRETVSTLAAANPVLEMDAPAAEISAGDPLSQTDFTDRDDGDDAALNELYEQSEAWGEGLLLAEPGAGTGREHFFQSLTEAASLQQILLEELQMCSASPRIREIAESVIGSLDDGGYLRTPRADLAMACDGSMEEVEEAVALVQSFDPPGIGASTPAECLRLQLLRRGNADPVLLEIVDHHLEDVGENRLPRVAKALHISLEDLQRYLAELRTLSPYPGAVLSPAHAAYIAPEAEIIADPEREGYFKVVPGDRPVRLYIPERYWKMLEDPALSAEDRNYVKEKIAAAQELMRALDQRESTIRRIAGVIAEEQREFFLHGVEALRPMTLREVGAMLDLHEATVSRAAAGKYVQTPKGLFEFRYFFSGGYREEDGNAISSRAVLEKIRKIVQGEDPAKPFSDSKIAELLQADGVSIARRTVAKYRESLEIAPAHLRKIHT
ncbi:MAG: RNA polymerase factor sigma-54 [Lentisphaeria bacterium]|nr:RNA polymerase factor sigma-54 [Lentisphaeria bacterium]